MPRIAYYGVAHCGTTFHFLAYSQRNEALYATERNARIGWPLDTYLTSELASQLDILSASLTIPSVR